MKISIPGFDCRTEQRGSVIHLKLKPWWKLILGAPSVCASHYGHFRRYNVARFSAARSSVFITVNMVAVGIKLRLQKP